jgi:hypothetical protein
MRSTRYALLLFGAGALLGLLLVSANLSSLGIVASALMAAALLFLPFALVADWWHHRPWYKPKPNRRARPRSSRQSKSPPPRKRGSRGE